MNINNFAYSPTSITIKVGTTVRWVNQDSAPHTVTRDMTPGPFSGILNQGDSYMFTFNQTGTFPYHCMLHPDMHGTVNVVP